MLNKKSSTLLLWAITYDECIPRKQQRTEFHHVVLHYTIHQLNKTKTNTRAIKKSKNENKKKRKEKNEKITINFPLAFL